MNLRGIVPVISCLAFGLAALPSTMTLGSSLAPPTLTMEVGYPLTEVDEDSCVVKMLGSFDCGNPPIPPKSTTKDDDIFIITGIVGTLSFEGLRDDADSCVCSFSQSLPMGQWRCECNAKPQRQVKHRDQALVTLDSTIECASKEGKVKTTSIKMEDYVLSCD